MADIEQLYAAIQNGFDLLDKRAVMIEVMASLLEADASKNKEET